MWYSYNLDPVIKAVREIVPPRFFQIVLFFTLATLVYVFTFIDSFKAAFINRGLSPEPTLSSQLHGYTGLANHLPYADNLILGLWWALVGVFLYIFAIALLDMWIYFITRINLLQKSYTATGHYFLLGVNEFRRCIWIFILLVTFTTFFRDFLPYLLSQFHHALLDLVVWKLFLSIIEMALIMYVIYLSFWFTLRNPRIIGKKVETD